MSKIVFDDADFLQRINQISNVVIINKLALTKSHTFYKCLTQGMAGLKTFVA